MVYKIKCGNNSSNISLQILCLEARFANNAHCQRLWKSLELLWYPGPKHLYVNSSHIRALQILKHLWKGNDTSEVLRQEFQMH